MLTVFYQPFVSPVGAVASGMALAVTRLAGRTGALVAVLHSYQEGRRRIWTRHNIVPKTRHRLGSVPWHRVKPPTPQHPLLAVPYNTEGMTQNQHWFFFAIIMLQHQQQPPCVMHMPQRFNRPWCKIYFNMRFHFRGRLCAVVETGQKGITSLLLPKALLPSRLGKYRHL